MMVSYTEMVRAFLSTRLGNIVPLTLDFSSLLNGLRCVGVTVSQDPGLVSATQGRVTIKDVDDTRHGRTEKRGRELGSTRGEGSGYVNWTGSVISEPPVSPESDESRADDLTSRDVVQL